MAEKRYALIAIAGAAGLFLLTIAANVAFDPEGVFGTHLFARSPNWNERHDRLRAYKSEAASVDGLIFSSSRGNLLDRPLLAKSMGAAHLFSLSVPFGMMPDHLPILEYILRDKESRGQRLKAVVLLLDSDFFGKEAWTNSNINSFLPPELSGEPAMRYWWRYLTAYQFRMWRDIVRTATRRSQSKIQPDPAPRGSDQASHAEQSILPGEQRTAPAGPRDPFAIPPSVMIPKTFEGPRRFLNSLRPEIDRQAAMLARFAALCRQHGVQLTIAMSPLTQTNMDMYDGGTLDAVTERLSQIVPLWDFNSPPVLARRREYWLDLSHFDRVAGNMMIDRMFGNDQAVALPDFGRRRGAP